MTPAPVIPSPVEEILARRARAATADHGAELKRGAVFNTIALLASNFRGIFTFLVARLLGPAALGIFSVAWATTDLISKIGIFGLDNAVTTFIARAEAAGDRARSRALFRLVVALALVQSAVVAVAAIVFIRIFGDRLGLQPELVSALAVLFCAMPGVALYRVSVAVSRGMKVMEHDIYSRGLTESAATTLAFLVALGVGLTTFAPEVAVIAGTAASGLVALLLAGALFRGVPPGEAVASLRSEARRLLAFAAPISAYQLLNSVIFRLDVIMLAFFIGRAPGVTLATVGIYGAVVEVAGGLRKVNQAFNPIFAPVVAEMTATGEQGRAAATYAQLAQWMLWILCPLVAALALAGGAILLIFGPAFPQGSTWLTIVALACATNAFVSLGETVLMVQRPHLNLINSLITCAVAVGANLWLIPRFGVMGAAFGILLPFVVQGGLRYGALRWLFKWRNPWSNVAPPILATIAALVPALVCRALLGGNAGQIVAAVIFLALFGALWWRHSRPSGRRPA
ncbi:polysaccharide biosynthesis C-terminal domain-containing protein [soil metagenome]